MARKNRKKKTRVQKMAGGSMLNPPERQEYGIGSVVKGLTKGATALIKKATKSLPKKQADKVIKEAEKRTARSADEGVPYILDEGEIEDIVTMERELGELELRGVSGKGTLVDTDRLETVLIEEFGYTQQRLDEIGESFDTQEEYLDHLGYVIEMEGEQVQMQMSGQDADERFAAPDPDNLFEDTPTGQWEGETINDPPRFLKQEGGSMLVPPEMEGAPVDTYPNIPPEELAEVKASQLPDAEVESDYVDFVMNEALDGEEQSYLMNALESDPQLSMIFDKVVDTASEFSGAGAVDGPGDGVSDSIPARLSAGEFVVTKKATDQLGADNLQTMMDEAERAYDGGLMGQDKAKGEDINEAMLFSNQMPSLNVRQR